MTQNLFTVIYRGTGPINDQSFSKIWVLQLIDFPSKNRFEIVPALRLH